MQTHHDNTSEHSTERFLKAEREDITFKTARADFSIAASEDIRQSIIFSVLKESIPQTNKN